MDKEVEEDSKIFTTEEYMQMTNILMEIRKYVLIGIPTNINA